jgi:hypothetical protein
MPTDGRDKVQQEIEEILDRLDNFVPEERLATKIRNRSRRKAEPSGPGLVERISKRFSRVTLGQLMLAGLALLAVAFFFRGPLGDAANWLLIAGLVLTVGAFVVSIVTGGGTRRTVSGRVEKRWRGQIIEYSEPTRSNRLVDWFRGRRRR